MIVAFKGLSGLGSRRDKVWVDFLFLGTTWELFR